MNARHSVMAIALLTSCQVHAASWSYPPSPRGEVADVYHGAAVADPYRWLEDLDSPETAAWVKAQNDLTFGFLSTLPKREAFRARLTELWNYGREGLPVKAGSARFFERNDGLQNQAVLWVADGPDGAPRMLLDPNSLAADGTVALASWVPSHDGTRLAYATSASGSDWQEIRVRDVATGKDLGDAVRWVKFSGLSWTRDGKGFVYSRYPEAPKAEGNQKTFSDLRNQKIYYHRIGTPQAEDTLLFELPEQPKWFLGGQVTEDGRYLVIYLREGTKPENKLYVRDLKDPMNPDFSGPLLRVVDAFGASLSVVGTAGDDLIVLTTQGAPRRRVVGISPTQPAPTAWRTLVPEPEGTEVIENAGVVGGRLVVESLRNASNRLQVFPLTGGEGTDLPLPGIGTVTGFSGRAEDPEVHFGFTSYSRPATNYRARVATGETSVQFAPKLTFNPDDYETRQVVYPSRDGTPVSMFITHRKGLKLDGNAPTLLYGYGGFNISLTPAFSVSNLLWLERGGVYAVPNLRGGGEYGKVWHEAGTLARKQNVFDDFIAAAEWLVANGYTRPERLAIAGGSNGGLLVGATANQRPDLFRVALPAVGVMDMLRFHLFTVGYAWKSDYGSSEDPAGFRYLKAYSPLHTVKPNTAYPAVLVTTADHDDRVHPAHSFKYAAEMQYANPRPSLPTLIRIETKAGHGAGKPTSKRIEEAADVHAFTAHFLGMD